MLQLEEIESFKNESECNSRKTSHNQVLTQLNTNITQPLALSENSNGDIKTNNQISNFMTPYAFS